MGDSQREPLLSQLLDDPMTQVLMLSDGVDPRELRHLITKARQRIAEADADGARRLPSRPR